ncbi:hypothetical protein [Paraburkholderia sp. HD33-4]|uniref:hypothetical protein n=1 Tax=Paraburkholderia sp. HD33-4 TaxID=2883242 RepID=UPI001F2B4D2E|nr:hypothetical protein [Paraburkholderia sp. HD33-4]
MPVIYAHRGHAMRKTYRFALNHAEEIAAILSAHKFSNPVFVEEYAKEFDLTIGGSPVGKPTLLDMGAILNELEALFSARVQFVTTNSIPYEMQDLVKPLVEEDHGA